MSVSLPDNDNNNNNNNGQVLHLTLAGKQLANVEGWFGCSDPFYEILALTESSLPGGNNDDDDSDADDNKNKNETITFSSIYRSEYIENSLNPVWKQATIRLDLLCNNDLDQPIRIDIYDWEDGNNRHRAMGSCLSTVRALIELSVEEPSKTLPIPSDDGTAFGELVIVNATVGVVDASRDELSPADPTNTSSFWLTLRGQNLTNVEGWFGGYSDPFFEVSTATDATDGSSEWQSIYRSEHIENNLNPEWKAAPLDLDLLCKGDLDKSFHISVFDWEESGKHRSMGFFTTSVNELVKVAGNPTETFALVENEQEFGQVAVVVAEVPKILTKTALSERKDVLDTSEQREQEKLDAGSVQSKVSDGTQRSFDDDRRSYDDIRSYSSRRSCDSQYSRGSRSYSDSRSCTSRSYSNSPHSCDSRYSRSYHSGSQHSHDSRHSRSLSGSRWSHDSKGSRSYSGSQSYSSREYSGSPHSYDSRHSRSYHTGSQQSHDSRHNRSYSGSGRSYDSKGSRSYNSHNYSGSPHSSGSRHSRSYHSGSQQSHYSRHSRSYSGSRQSYNSRGSRSYSGSQSYSSREYSGSPHSYDSRHGRSYHSGSHQSHDSRHSSYQSCDSPVSCKSGSQQSYVSRGSRSRHRGSHQSCDTDRQPSGSEQSHDSRRSGSCSDSRHSHSIYSDSQESFGVSHQQSATQTPRREADSAQNNAASHHSRPSPEASSEIQQSPEVPISPKTPMDESKGSQSFSSSKISHDSESESKHFQSSHEEVTGIDSQGVINRSGSFTSASGSSSVESRGSTLSGGAVNQRGLVGSSGMVHVAGQGEEHSPDNGSIASYHSRDGYSGSGSDYSGRSLKDGTGNFNEKSGSFRSISSRSCEGSKGSNFSGSFVDRNDLEGSRDENTENCSWQASPEQGSIDSVQRAANSYHSTSSHSGSVSSKSRRSLDDNASSFSEKTGSYRSTSCKSSVESQRSNLPGAVAGQISQGEASGIEKVASEQNLTKSRQEAALGASPGVAIKTEQQIETKERTMEDDVSISCKSRSMGTHAVAYSSGESTLANSGFSDVDLSASYSGRSRSIEELKGSEKGAILANLNLNPSCGLSPAAHDRTVQSLIEEGITTDDIAAMKEEIASLKKVLQDRDAQLKTAEEQLTERAAENLSSTDPVIGSQSQTMEQLSEEVCKLQNSLVYANSEIRHYKNISEEANQTIVALRKVSAVKIEKIDVLEKSLLDTKSEAFACKNNAEEARERVAVLERKIESQNNAGSVICEDEDLEGTRQKLKEAEASLYAHRTQLKQTKQEIVSMTTEHSIAAQKNADLEEKIGLLQDEIAVLKGVERIPSNREHVVIGNNSWATVLDRKTLEDLALKAEEDKKVYEQKIATGEEEMNKLRDENVTISRKLAKFRKVAEKNFNLVCDAKVLLGRYKEERKKQTSVIERMKLEVREKSIELQAAIANASQLQSVLKSREQNLDRLNQKVLVLAKENKTLNASLAKANEEKASAPTQQEIDELNAKIVELEDDLDVVLEELEDARAEVEPLERALQEKDVEIRKNEEAITKLRKEVENAGSRIAGANQNEDDDRVVELEEELEALQEESEELRFSVEQLENNAAKLEKDRKAAIKAKELYEGFWKDAKEQLMLMKESI